MKILYTQNKQRQDNKRGFTIIETLVAVFILLITTTGPLTFTQSGLRSSFLARDQITAFYLAQDSIEYLKNLRDQNQIAANDTWLDQFGACAPVSEGADGTVSCNIDSILDQTAECIISPTNPNGTCPALYYEVNKGNFSMTNGTDFEVSKYTRTMYVTLINAKELQVIVEVSWDSQLLSGLKRIVVQENIYKKY